VYTDLAFMEGIVSTLEDGSLQAILPDYDQTPRVRLPMQIDIQ